MSRLGRNLRQRQPVNQKTPIQQAISLLCSFGPNAHVYLPGIGMLNGLQAANYIDSAGTQVGVVDSIVGLDLDAMGVAGVELISATTAVGGGYAAGVFTENTSSSSHGVSFTAACPANRCEFAFRAKAGTKSWVLVYFGGYPSGAVWFDLANGVVGTQEIGVFGVITPSTDGYYDCKVTKFNASAAVSAVVNAATANGVGTPYLGTGSVAFYLSSASVREITGIHASQATTGSKPILRRGAVNLLTNSHTLSGLTLLNATLVSNLLAATATTGVHRGYLAVTTVSGAPYTFAIKATQGGYRYLYSFGLAAATFDLVNGTVTGSGTMTLLGDGSYLCIISGNAAGSSLAQYVAINSTAATGDNSFAGDGISGINLHAAALFQGTYTAAQIQALGGIPLTTTAPASTALGPYWWDTAGGKSLNAAFPVGNESVTVIDAAKTGQVTLTGQNVVGSYNVAEQLGPELCTDPSLQNSGAWFLGTGWTISGGVATHTGSSGQMSQTIAQVGKRYKINFTSAYTNVINVFIGTSAVGVTPVVGVNTVYITAATNGVVGMSGGGGYSISRFSCAEVLSDVSGKIIINAALTAPETALLQNLANKVAGL